MTQTQLLACANASMHWISERFGSTLHFHLRGHSEGALLSLMLYRELAAQEPTLAAQINTLILTGTPLEPFRTIIESQLEVVDEHDGGALRNAVSQCDWPTVGAFVRYEGVSEARVCPLEESLWHSMSKDDRLVLSGSLSYFGINLSKVDLEKADKRLQPIARKRAPAEPRR